MTLNKQKFLSPKPAQRGVALLEALVSILLFSMGVLALVGLQSAMIKNTSDSKFRADAAYIAQQEIGMLWADPANITPNIAPLAPPGIPISDLPSGVLTVTQPSPQNFPNQYLVTVIWQQPGELQHNYTTVVSIAGG